MKITPFIIKSLPEAPGIYKFINKKRTIIYIGKAKNLKKRITSHFSKSRVNDLKSSILINQTRLLEYTVVNSEFEALLLEAKLIKKYQPKYNVIWKDDKHYIYIKITKEEYPRVLLSRKNDNINASFVGPFPSSKTVREILALIRLMIPYCTQSPNNYKKGCFYTHLGLCSPCPADIKKKNGEVKKDLRSMYLQNINQIKMILSGQSHKVHSYLQERMDTHSNNEEFESAAIYRDRLKKLNYLFSHFQPSDTDLDNPFLSTNKWRDEQKDLLGVLKPYFPKLKDVARLECYDISSLSGRLATGSLVTFIDGYPAKDLYRRFKIKLKNTPDDFSMLKEIMQRRLSHQEWSMPDLIIIDGGRPQLESLKYVFSDNGVNIPFIGLAKKEEDLVIPYNKNYYKLKLKKSSHALHVVQRIRDEAHRFAHNYHQLLRLKYMFAYIEK